MSATVAIPDHQPEMYPQSISDSNLYIPSSQLVRSLEHLHTSRHSGVVWGGSWGLVVEFLYQTSYDGFNTNRWLHRLFDRPTVSGESKNPVSSGCLRLSWLARSSMYGSIVRLGFRSVDELLHVQVKTAVHTCTHCVPSFLHTHHVTLYWYNPTISLDRQTLVIHCQSNFCHKDSRLLTLARGLKSVWRTYFAYQKERA